MSERKNRNRAPADARDVASTSDSQSSLLLPSKPIKGRKRSSSNVGQSRALIPLSKEYLLRALPDSSAQIASIQKRLRTPLNDKIFLWSGMLGAVEFFMCFLPAFFFLGYGPEGRELVTTLALGIYFTSLVKDIAQIPRPLAPPVTRLSLEYHALEYGFPSSHCGSTTSFGAFYFLLLSRASSLTPLWGWVGGSVITGLWLLVCFGRIYCGMHTPIDCFFGGFLGLATSFLFAALRSQWEFFLSSPSFTTPLILALLVVVVCTVRPDPPIPSVSYPDAIAFTSVVLGVSLARWVEVGGGWDFEQAGTGTGWVSSGRWTDLLLGQAGKYLAGIVSIVVYKLGAKIVLEHIYTVFLGSPRFFSAPASQVNSPAVSTRSSPSTPSTPLFTPLQEKASFGSKSARRQDPLVPLVVAHGPLGSISHLYEVTSERVPLIDGGLATPPVEGNEADRLEWERKKREGGKRKLTAGEGESIKSGRQIFTKVVVYAGIGFLAAFVLPLSFISSGVGLR